MRRVGFSAALAILCLLLPLLYVYRTSSYTLLKTTGGADSVDGETVTRNFIDANTFDRHFSSSAGKTCMLAMGVITDGDIE